MEVGVREVGGLTVTDVTKGANVGALNSITGAREKKGVDVCREKNRKMERLHGKAQS